MTARRPIAPHRAIWNRRAAGASYERIEREFGVPRARARTIVIRQDLRDAIVDLEQLFPRNQAWLWLSNPHAALGGETPLRRIRSGRGSDVRALLAEMRRPSPDEPARLSFTVRETARRGHVREHFLRRAIQRCELPVHYEPSVRRVMRIYWADFLAWQRTRIDT